MATKTFKGGDVLFEEGAHPARAYRIVKGSVELTRIGDGAALPYEILDRGDLVGAEELVEGRPMAATAQALGPLVVEEIAKAQAEQLLGKSGRKVQRGKPVKPSAKQQGTASSRALVALSSQGDKIAAGPDTASSVLKPGLLRRILNPEFADVYDRLDVRIAVLEGDGGEQATQHLVAEIGQRRGIRAKALNAKITLDIDGDPVRAMRELKRASERWLVDNGGDVLVWGEVAPGGVVLHLRFFVLNQKPVDQFRIGDGWTLLVLPLPLDSAAAHRLHATLLAAVRTQAAGKQLTVRRDLDVLMADARELLLAETPNLSPYERAEDRATVARVFANATRIKRRADDARTAMSLLDTALTVFSAEETPVEWAMAHRDRAFLGQFIAERANDTDALRASVTDVETALSVLGPSLFPYDWASLNDRLGLALYRLDFDNGDTNTLQRALNAFQDALTVYDKRKTPVEWSETMGHFGQVALIIGRENRSASTLLRAVEACNDVLSARDRRKMPLHWASAQNNLGSALFLYGRVTGDSEALMGARKAFQTAHAIYLEKDADRLATVAAKNLRHVDKALERKSTKLSPPALPWEGNGSEPPTLPWELEPRTPASKPDEPKRREGGDFWTERAPR